MRFEDPGREVRVDGTGMTVIADADGSVELRIYSQGRVGQRVAGMRKDDLFRSIAEAEKRAEEVAKAEAEAEGDAPKAEAASDAGDGAEAEKRGRRGAKSR